MLGVGTVLLASGLSVYTANVRVALAYLPALGSTTDAYRLTEALQSIAASKYALSRWPSSSAEAVTMMTDAWMHALLRSLIICVSLTGVLMVQGAQGFAHRPSTSKLVRKN